VKIKKSQLRQIIKEEIELILEDGNLTIKEVEKGLGLTAGAATDEWERLSKLPQKDYPDALKKYLGIALDEGAPFHDMFDEFVPFEQELAEKVLDAGGTADESTMSVKPTELEKQLWEWVYDAAGEGGLKGVDQVKELYYDVVERILYMQKNNEDV
jgi:hypothetical protein